MEGPSKGKGKAKKAPKVPWNEKYDETRTQPADPRDPRTLGPPCNGSHEPKRFGNQHASWVQCLKCKLRISYVPAFGSHGAARSAGPIAVDAQEQLNALGNEAHYSHHLHDRAIGVDAAEKSCLRKLEQIQKEKSKMLERGAKPKASVKKTEGPIVEIADEKDSAMPPHPGRKTRKADVIPENLDAKESPPGSDGSWRPVSPLGED